MLKIKKPFVTQLVQYVKDHRKDMRIIKPTINIIRLLLCNKECVELFLEQFKGLDGMIALLLSSQGIDFSVCTNLMFIKYQLKHNGGKALKTSDDSGLDDILVKKFYKEFRRDPRNKRQIDVIEKLKSKENIEDDDSFVKNLIEEGEIFNLQEKRILVDFQIDIDSDMKESFAKAIKEARDDFATFKKQSEEGNVLHPGLQKEMKVEDDSASESDDQRESSESENEDEKEK